MNKGLPFDNALSLIEHFRLHPELLPFVGSHYEKYRILLVGESHYLPENTAVKAASFAQWYETTTPAEFSTKDLAQMHTRNILQSYFDGNHQGGRSMFHRPAYVIYEALGEKNAELDYHQFFQYYSFFNYFQRPELVSGASIRYTKQDEEQAYTIAVQIFEALQPELIVFLSKKAYRSFYNHHQNAREWTDRIDYTVHPSCPWWNRNDGKHGANKFRKIIEKAVRK